MFLSLTKKKGNTKWMMVDDKKNKENEHQSNDGQW